MGVARFCCEKYIHDKVVIIIVEPVRQHDWTNIDVVVAITGGTMDDNRAGETIDVLSTVVAVPPVNIRIVSFVRTASCAVYRACNTYQDVP